MSAQMAHISRANRQQSLDNLPRDLQYCILAHLSNDRASFGALCTCCKPWAALLNEHDLWRHLFRSTGRQAPCFDQGIRPVRNTFFNRADAEDLNPMCEFHAYNMDTKTIANFCPARSGSYIIKALFYAPTEGSKWLVSSYLTEESSIGGRWLPPGGSFCTKDCNLRIREQASCTLQLGYLEVPVPHQKYYTVALWPRPAGQQIDRSELARLRNIKAIFLDGPLQSGTVIPLKPAWIPITKGDYRRLHASLLNGESAGHDPPNRRSAPLYVTTGWIKGDLPLMEDTQYVGNSGNNIPFRYSTERGECSDESQVRTVLGNKHHFDWVPVTMRTVETLAARRGVNLATSPEQQALFACRINFYGWDGGTPGDAILARESNKRGLLPGQYRIGSKGPQFSHAGQCSTTLPADTEFELLCLKLAI